MGRKEKTYEKIMSGNSDSSINFNDLRYMILAMGFRERIRGDHHFMSRNDIIERINIQPDGSDAKPYQVKQIRELIKKYKLEV